MLAPLLLVAPPLRTVLESRMALHMLLLLPLLMAGGWAAARWVRQPRWMRAVDTQGLLGLTFVSCMAALWMVPAALDFSLVSEGLRWTRLLGWWLAGAVLGWSWPRMGPEIAVFFLGNLAWMSATAGLLYQDAEQRLCVNYLFDEQRWTGRGLVALALVLGALAVRRAVQGAAAAPAAHRPTQPASGPTRPAAGRIDR